jgi:hypothetical protein
MMFVRPLSNGLMLSVLFGHAALAEPPAAQDKQEQAESITIPLERIWAYRMPGARDIDGLVSELAKMNCESNSQNSNGVSRKKLWSSIATSLMEESPFWPGQGKTARPGFVVSGKAVEALEGARSVIVRGDRPHESIVAGNKISIVFFSYQFANYVHLQRVERTGSTIDVRYRFVQPINRIQTVHIALIPLGRLLPGDYRVEMTAGPIGQELFDGRIESRKTDRRSASLVQEWHRRFVCQSFEFSVVDSQIE